MKKLLCFVLPLLLLFTSCNQEMESCFAPNTYPQKWTLVKMTGSFANSETTGDAMDWQEYYILNSDQTFTKIRTRDGATETASGVYLWLNDTDGTTTLDLTYTSANVLVGSCIGETKEYLILTEEGQLFNSGWVACDGPGLYYSLLDTPEKAI